MSYPDWFTDESRLMFDTKYLYKCKNAREQYERIAKTIAAHTNNHEYWCEQFFTMFWEGLYSLSTPSLSNTGTDRGYPIACSGGYVHDSILGFTEAWKENSLLTQNGAGTSYYLGGIRGRGQSISRGGCADGACKQFQNLRRISQEISQGNTRRGSVACYYPIDGLDFWEIFKFVKNNPDDSNIGWCVSDANISDIQTKSGETYKRWRNIIWLRITLGKGFIFKTDTVNRARHQALVDAGLLVYASNLCSEITLPSSAEYTFSCVLGALNLIHWERIRRDGWVGVAVTFLDALISYYISAAKGKPGMDKIIHFTEDFRALGLGVMGLHSLYQYKGLSFGSMEAHLLNGEIFKTIQHEAIETSLQLGAKYGECKIMSGSGRRNTHLTACMPTMSTSTIMGGYSEGINPITMNVMIKDGTSAEFEYINPWFKELCQSKNIFTEELIQDVGAHDGSFQHRREFTDEEKKIGLSAFEIPQEYILRQASVRQRHLCQSQSLNLFFSQNENPRYISKIHSMLLLDEYIQTAYYVRSSAKTRAHDNIVCESCQ